MMAQFELSIEYVLDNEGRTYSEPPMDDQPTKFGIIMQDLADYYERDISEFTKDDIKNLDQDTAEDIYRALYWNKMGLDDVADQNVATCIFDTGVNRGIRVGAIYAQQVSNGYGSALVIDGAIGPLSKAAINRVPRSYFIGKYECLEWAGYQAILVAHPEDEIYRNGWQNRAERLLTLI